MALLVVGAVVGGCTEEDGRLLRLGHSLDTAHPVHQALVAMADDLARRSNGRLRMAIYPGEQLGSERESMELLQLGSLDLTKTSASVAEAFVPAWGVLGLPYLFPDRDARFAALEGPIGRDLLTAGRPARLLGLAWLDAGSRSFYTRDQPILIPADLEGLKIRVQESPSAMRMVRTLGGAPTPIAWGELYTALDQGVVDGAENNPPSFHLSRHYEVARFLSLDQHTAVPDVLLVSTVTWDALSETERHWLRAAAQTGASKQKELWREAEARALDEVTRAGVTVIRPDTRAFAAKVAPLYDRARADPAIGPWLNRLQTATAPR